MKFRLFSTVINHIADIARWVVTPDYASSLYLWLLLQESRSTSRRLLNMVSSIFIPPSTHARAVIQLQR
ncbi:Hypothetical predicted protein [Olea europaea subsp. europaea]|uniref:Uncharacterized protein n=1 Tax=Olea europaea subsp. europaea TaxID=158383 RepID=A0A8S0UCJ2_OLEEU|nr:Hypothetical predicted protein [Olea europaea subsp. europaea]